ncbi:aminopeptidase P N-terminal domain-containing protein [Janthinobacterium fluminis]|uniref:Xaa-Pro aminopeptidase n=1 Tax=Janthinobacterium fluminis TaxID=2987524 RepID=A0ABT5K3D5_9BURK|nr:aminopeptidase P N-terminal domain-containing protein [Janthinobacterium fluminis]MDC8759482.1 aminopeptidase P N-terminal domain-containing protein [Janthinobacterium fluminis]
MTAHAARRAALLAQMAPGGVAVLATAPEVTRNSDCDYPYRHDSYFYYLSGFGEPESVLVLVAGGARGPARSILFCREKNSERKIWDGFRHGPDAARLACGVDAAFAIDELDAQMGKLLADAPALYYAHGGSAELDARVKLWLGDVKRQARSGVTAPAVVHNVLGLLDEMRLFKDDGEQATMRRACAISGQAHARAMRATRPGMREYAIEAELLYEFRRNGAQFPAYSPIVAAGANACVLHYHANNALVRDGELVLIDAGCELDGYAADITRTYPANGRFSAPQRQLYELVLAAQAAALDAVRPGQRYQAIHAAALAVLAQGMLDLGLLDRDKAGNADDVIANQSYLQFYMHGTGHWLGMDVHDVGAYRETAREGKPWRPLQPGMTLTVEPGLYVRPAAGVPEAFWHTGIRIEDDVLVTADGHAVLSGEAPKSVAAIEQLMQENA